MTTESITTIISVISSLVAIISIFFAWRAVESAEKTYTIQLITQIYNIYNSPAMRQDLQIIWRLYRQAWQSIYKDNPEKANEKTNNGSPISDDFAQKFFQEVESNSPEYKAVDNVLLFWDYIAFITSRKMLKINDLSAFMTPRILGYLYPIERAKANYFTYNVEPASSLQSLYERWKRISPATF
jgi:hypothetical protein